MELVEVILLAYVFFIVSVQAYGLKETIREREERLKQYNNKS